MTDRRDELEDYLTEALADPEFARLYAEAGRRIARDRTTALRVSHGTAWLRVAGYGLWLRWGRTDRDLFTTRRDAHYWGPIRGKVLRPPACVAGDDERELRRVSLRPVDEAEDDW